MHSEKSHSCTPNTAATELALKLQKIREKVVSTNDSIPTIFNETIAEYQDTGLSLLETPPKFKSQKSALYRARNKIAGVTKTHYRSAQEVEVPSIVEDFLLAEYNDNTTRILIFCTKDMKEILNTIQHVFMDGTFKSCPQHFSELYVILGDINSDSHHTNVVPLIYALLTKRDKTSYTKLFEVIKTAIPNFSPTKFTLDFEKASMAAIKEVFPEAEIKGCYFHFSQCIWKKGKQLGLTKCTDTRKIVSLTSVLPLLPKEHISDAWSYVKEDTTTLEEAKEEINKFIDYMMRQWLTTEEWIGVWCVNQELHRTNNVVESWNARLNKIIKKKQPTLLHLLKVLKKDSKYYTLRLARHETNEKLIKHVSRNRYIGNVLEQLLNKTITVGHCLEKLRK